MAYNSKPKREEEKYDVERERQLYYAMLADPANQAEYKKALGPSVDLNRWLSACRDAVEANPKLLAPSLRASLLFSVKKAAQQTLRPDGKQGALVPRFNKDARQYMVSWQPMLQGVLLLGRRAGVLRDFTAEIVFAGEPFKFLRGDDPKIIHEWIPDIREKAYSFLRPPPSSQPQGGPPDEDAAGPDYAAFWDLVVAAYCIIEAPDGSRTRRAMARSRLLLLRDFSRAQGGPWNSVFLDEMIVKAAVHYTVKHVDTVPKDEDAGRVFRAALDQDMDADLSDLDDDVVEGKIVGAPSLPALAAPNPMDKLSRFETNSGRERVSVDRNTTTQQSNDRRETQPANNSTNQQDRRADDGGQQQENQQQKVDDGNGKGNTQQQQTQASPGADEAAERALIRLLNQISEATDLAAKKGSQEPLINVLGDPKNQATIARLRDAYRPHYKTLIAACAKEPIVQAVAQLETAYPEFYFDVIQVADEDRVKA